MINEGLVKNIIDSGSYIGDNSIPWAKNVKGTIYAIDPSEENCSFTKKICEFNGIQNVVIYNLALSDKNEILLTDEDIHHCSFVKSRGINKVDAVSLDYLCRINNITNIDYIHLDVEGMEQRVILGCDEVINTCRPIIAFEQHLKTDNYNKLSIHLKTKNYSVFIIDEVLPDCRPDCRNFIAFPNEKVFKRTF